MLGAARVDVLALPLSAPWTKFSETAAFAAAVGPASVVPIHDSLLAPRGRGAYLTNLGRVLPGLEVRDLREAGPTRL